MLKPLALMSLIAACGLGLLIWTRWEKSSLPPSDVIEQPATKTAAPDNYERGRARGDSEAKIFSDEPATNNPSLTEARPRAFALDAASGILEEAHAGNPDAQFELSRALDYCRRKYIFLFGRDGRRTLDQGLALASTQGTSVDEARQVHERCHSYMEGNTKVLGTADEWLERAAAAGHYRAQLLRAQNLLIEATFPRVDQEAVNPQQIQLQKAVLLEGLKRKDPAALWTVGELQKDDKNSWAWFLAACKSGYDCSPSAEWYQYFCEFDYNCQPYESGIEMIQRLNAGRYPDLDRLSSELLDKLNAGELRDLGLRVDAANSNVP